MRPLKWGLQSSPQHVTYSELLQLWQRIDALGYDSAWLFDHFLPINGDESGPCLEGWITLAALAVQTSRLHAGLLVTSMIYRPPALLAKMAATLDIATGGRLEMGLGAGWFEGETLAYGMPFPPSAERLRRLDEGLQMIRQLWTQETSDFNGRYYTLHNARLEPKPVQKPCPTLWVGGQGEKVTLRIVAEQADGWDTDLMPLERYRQKVQALEQHCDRAGRDPASVRKMLHFPALLTPDASRVQVLAAGLAQSWNTTPAELEGRFLIGTPQQAAEKLLPYIELGAEHFVLSVAAPYDMSLIELFIQEVAPAAERLR